MSLQAEKARRVASAELDPERKATLGQFMTPEPIASFMASLFRKWPRTISLLEPGAGIGSLAEAFGRAYREKHPINGALHITAYEVEKSLFAYLEQHMHALEKHVGITTEIIFRDFIRETTFASSFGSKRFTHVIMNPPYKKIAAQSEYRKLLSSIGVQTGNLYTTFLALALEVLADHGELVAIIPRSFCNGMYFRPFREWLLDRVSITQIHVFESRSKAFSDDSVLQENIIIRLEKRVSQGPVVISTSDGKSFDNYQERTLPFEDVVKPDDKERYIYIPTFQVNERSSLFAMTLKELGLDVSTGPVVDFRLREHSLSLPADDSVPLLYAHHFSTGEVVWPKAHRKPNALAHNDSTRKWLMPRGWYTITKRFSSKEEKRRLVAYVVDPKRLPHKLWGFENHLNVIHSKKTGIEPDLARGLAMYLNSTVVDQHFRNFSGHTQVNATDLRTMHFPERRMLLHFGKWAAKHQNITQEQIDEFIGGIDGDEARTDR